MPKASSSTNPAPTAGTSATGAASPAAQGAAGAPAATAPGAAVAAQRTPPHAASTVPTGTTLPVQTDDGTESFMAWALSQAGVDGLDLPSEAPAPQRRTPAASKAAQSDDDEDEDILDDGTHSDDGTDEDDAPASDPDASESDAFDPDAPVLGEEAAEDATGDAEDDDDDTDPKASKLKKDNFKLREKRRELQEALQAKEQEIAEMRQKLEQTALPADTAPNYGGYFTGVKTLADVDAVEEQIQADLDYLEDHPDGYDYTDAQGQLQTVTADQVKAYRRQAVQNQRMAGKVRDHLKTYQETASKADQIARKKYPFVFDSKHPRNSAVLDLAKEFPALSKHPQRALILGRMAVARLVESGEYTLTKRGTPAPVGKATSSSSSSPAAPRQVPSRQARHHTPDPEMSRRIAAGDTDAITRAALALIER